MKIIPVLLCVAFITIIALVAYNLIGNLRRAQLQSQSQHLKPILGSLVQSSPPGSASGYN